MRIKMGPHSTKHDNSGDSSTTDLVLNDNENVVEQTVNNDTIDSVSSDAKESGPVYYAVYIPLDTVPAADMSDCSTTIFEDRLEALKLVKKYKKARFKAFNCFVEATQFAINGMGLIPQNMITGNHEQNSSESIETFVNNVLNLSVGEKPSPFKGPKSQDFVKLRKAIENDDFITVQKTISDNPRYLVSYGDTPAILQEGSRYNALHVCARTNRAAICSFILDTISNVGFILRLYGGDSTKDSEAAHDRCNVLLDLYLNTPDKGCNETPLHFAVKYGSVDVVKVLVSYPQCDKTRPNKFGQTPKEIICSRVSGSGDNGDLYKKISALLEEQYYVPVLRSEDSSIQPTIGQPFSPSKPLELSGDVVSPAMEIQGLAGPMPLDSARAFRRKWKTPPRDPKSHVSPILKAMLEDTEKGLEKVGRELADENQVLWTEFWPFLNTFTDFRTEQGLQLLEHYLLHRFKDMTVVSRFDNFCTNKEEKSKAAEGSDIISSDVDNSVKSQQSPSAFKKSKTPTRRSKLASSSSSSSLPSVPKTCSTSDYLSYKLLSLSLENERSGSPKSAVSLVTSPSSTQQNHDSCRERYNGIINNSDDSNLGISPHLYVEKSCQVFARRITEGLLQFPESPSETIASEIGYITMLVVSCREDTRFAAVDFSRLHSHLASCILQRFNSNEEMEELAKSIDIILSRGQDLEDYSSEEEFTGPRSNIAREKDNRKQKICIHKGVNCIAKQISNRMSNFNFNSDERSSVNSSSINCNESNDQNNQEPPSTEEQCMRLWKLANSCDCVWSLQPFPRLRQSFRRNNHSSISRRIDFSASQNKEEKRNNDNEIRNSPNLVEKPVTDCCEESAGEESDTSDADSNEFFTPPSSPRTQMSLASSEDDLEMESPDEGPDVYIEGDIPTSIDNAVLDAIGQKELDPAVYPNICRWKHLVMLHTPAERERWPTPRKLRCVKHQNIDTSYYDKFSTKKDLESLRQNDI